MKPVTDHKSLLRLAVVQQLRGYGIKVKHWNSKQRLAPERVRTAGTSDSGKTFGTPLHELPQAFVQDYGNVPNFVVTACKHLELHASTEGLFRKSGSVVRLKALKSQLDLGEGCLSSAQPCDVAGLLKQFFRELPEPILRSDLQEAFCKAQQLSSEEEKTGATLLLSCLLPERTVDTLRYFFNFLRRVSLRSSENKMDSSNLAVIFAPNLLQSSDGSEKISASTEKKLRLQAAVVRTLIDHAADIGHVPDTLLEKIPAMLGVDADCGTPSLERYEDGEWESPGERKRRRRRSVGALASVVTPVILTPSTKRKLPLDSSQGFSNKKRKSLKHNLAFELLPSSLFSFTPASAQSDVSPCVSLETSRSSSSPSVASGKHSSSGNRRSKRQELKKMHRVESGKTGCFSPKISRKEMVRRSLRLKFSLGKSSRENLASAHASTSGTENIGWRLANQQELEQGVALSKARVPFSPVKTAKKGTKIISKSEENLLTPKCLDETNYRMSWTGPGPSEPLISDNEGTPIVRYLNPTNFYSEPVLVAGKPPAIPSELRPILSTCKPDRMPKDSPFSGEEKHLAEETLLMIKRAFSESGSDLRCLIVDSRSSASALEERPAEIGADSGVRLERYVTADILHITEAIDHCDNWMPNKFPMTENAKAPGQEEDSTSHVKENGSPSATTEPEMEKSETGETLDSAEVMRGRYQLPQITVYQDCSSDNQGNKRIEEVYVEQSEVLGEAVGLAFCTSEKTNVASQAAVAAQSVNTGPNTLPENPSHIKLCPLMAASSGPESKSLVISKHVRVSDHIQRFNTLSLNEHCSKKVKSPLNFQRTPVRQSVKRINSLSEMRRQPSASILAKTDSPSVPLVKPVSCDGFSSRVEQLVKNSAPPKPCPAVTKVRPSSTSLMQRNENIIPQKSGFQIASLPREGGSVRHRDVKEQKVGLANQSKSVLEDLTNHDASKATGRDFLDKKPRTGSAAAATSDCGLARKLSGKEKSRYRGSPKNPIAKAQLLPTSRPLEL